MSCKIKVFWKYMSHIFVKFHKKDPIIKKSAITPKLSKFLKLWSLHFQSQSKILQKRADEFFFQVFPEKGLFCIFLYVNRVTQPLLGFAWIFVWEQFLGFGKNCPKAEFRNSNYKLINFSLELAPPKKS